jgi:hypothetical protein
MMETNKQRRSIEMYELSHAAGSGLRRQIGTAALAGLVGGAAEVAWITLYSTLTGGSAVQVATGITKTFDPGLASGALAVPMGVAIHFGLAIVLGLAVTILIRKSLPKLAGTMSEFALVVAALAVVWAVNFLVILPLVNPAFVHAVPFAVSFASKLLFGIGAGLVLLLWSDPRPDSQKR